MTQNQVSPRLELRVRWQRLPIRVKLLIPVLVAFAVALAVLLARVIPTINALADNNLRTIYAEQADEVVDKIVTFLQNARQDMVQISNSSAVADFAAQATGNSTQQKTARAALENRLTGRMGSAFTAVPYADFQYVAKDGMQIVHAFRRPTAVNASLTPPEALVSIGDTDYFKAIMSLPQGQAYVLPIKVDRDSAPPDVQLQLGIPVYYQGVPVGALIAGIRVRDFLTKTFHPPRASEFTVSLVDQAGQVVVTANADEKAAVALLGDKEGLAQIPPEVLNRVDQSLTEAQGQLYGAFSLGQAENFAAVPWTLVYNEDASIARADAHNAGNAILLTLIVVLGIASFGIVQVSRVVTYPMLQVSQVASRLAAGDLRARVQTPGEDELGRVGAALNTMASRLADLVSTLEARVAERTRNLEIASEISRDASQLRNTEELLHRAVEAMRERFNFYHVQVFLLDEARENAVLISSTGEAGRQLLERKHKLAVGSDSIIGQVTAQGRTFITLDTQKSDVPHRFNPLLPATRSEMALPLRVGGVVIGALDVQSVEPDAFGESDVQIFQVLADQLAIAVDNARLLAQSQERLAQVAELNRQLTRSGWNEFLEDQSPQELAFKYDLSQVTAITERSQDGNVSAEIKVRGEVVGSLSVQESADAALSEEDHLVLQAIADRVALAVENARLIEQSQLAAARIQQLYQASRTLGGALDIEAILKIASDYLSTFEPLDRLIVLSAQPNPVPKPEFLKYLYTWDRSPHTDNQFSVQERIPGDALNWDRLLPDPRAPRIIDFERDMEGSESILKALETMGMRSMVIVPLATPTHWFGAMLCESQRDHAFSQSFVQFAIAIADQVAIAMDNRRLFENVQAEARRNRALAEAAQISSQIGVEFDEAIGNLFRAVAEPAEYDRWWFGQLMPSASGLTLQRVVSHFGEGSPLHHMARIALDVEQNALAEAARLGQLIVVNDPTTHPALAGLNRDRVRAFGKHLALPVRAGRNVIGALMVGRAQGEADLDERDIQLATTLGSQIAVLMENQRLFSTAETERQTLQAVLASLPTGVIVMDAKTGEFALTNDLARSLLGLDEAEPYRRIHTGSQLPYTDEEFPLNQVLTTLQPVFAEDMTVVRPSGDATDLIVNAAPVFDQDGTLISAVAVFQDVTELRELENVLQDSLRETTSLYEISRAFAAENELGNLLGVIASQVVGLLAPANLFAIFRDDQGEPAQVFTASTATDWRGVAVEGGCPLPRSVLRLEEPFLEANIAGNPELALDPQLQALQLAALAVLPLNARGRTVGWLVIGFAEVREVSADEQRFLSTLCDQAAVAAENARLSQATVQALSETTLLYEASYAINRANSIRSAVEIVRDQVRSFAPVKIDMFLVVARQAISTIDWVLAWDANDPTTHDGVRLENAPTIDDIHLIDAPPYFIDNLATASDIELAALHHLPGYENYAAQASVPLTVAGRPTGRLIVSFDYPYKFGRVERQFLTTLADQAAIVINNSMLVQQTQDSLEETGTLYQSSRAITDARELSDILSAVIDHAAPPIVSWAMLCRLVTPDWTSPGASLEVVASWDRTGGPDLSGQHFTPDQIPAWVEMASPALVWIEDVAKDVSLSENSRNFYASRNLASVISVPLNTAGRSVGALMLGSSEPWARNEREMRIYTSLADQVAISIENRNLLSQAERRARQLQTSAQVAQAATSILNLNELLDRTVNLIKDSFNYDHVQIFLVNAANTKAELVASTGEAGKQLLAINHSLPVGSVSIIGQATSTGLPQLTADATGARGVHKPNPYLPNTRSELALPLKAKGKILGALDVQSNRPGAFSAEDESILANLADQVAVAIDNARLFELSTQRVEEMRFLFDVTRTATGMAEETEATLVNVAHLIKDNLEALSTSILLLNETGDYVTRYSITGAETTFQEPNTFKLQDMRFAEVITERRPLIISDIGRADPEFQKLLPGSNSMVLVPLLAGDHLVGAVTATSAKINAYNEDTVQLLQTLSSTLAAIIQNAQLLEQVQAANVRLREVDKLKSQFLANMSHELRTPLNSIIGFSRVILKGIDGPLSPMQEQDLTTIHESGKHLLNLVNDILDQAKIEAGKMELSYSFFSVAELIKSVMSTAVGLVKDKPVRLHQEIEADLPQVWGDEFRSRQVLLNLVSNAAKFTAQGSITASAFRVEENGCPMVQLSVTDTGIGIPVDKQESIFEAFSQVESSTARQYEGTGLGLPIAKSLIEMQGGRIWVVSEPGVGSTFSFTLPTSQPKVETPEEPPVATEIAEQVAQAIEQAEAPQPNQRIILAIDDEMSIVNLYRRHLVRSGYEIIGGGPEEAEELAITYQPRVILLDVNMPRLSGWDVLARLKDRDETFEIPVIICSVETDKERAFRLGAADYLVKPIEEQTLIQTVKRVELERDRRKILIIDDQPDSIRLVRDALAADERFVIIEAVGGAQGVDMVNHHWPDLIILDLRMPEMDGFAVLDQLQSNPDTATIPVLVVTADDLTEEERQRLAHANVYQKQTTNADELLNSVVSQLTW